MEKAESHECEEPAGASLLLTRMCASRHTAAICTYSTNLQLSLGLADSSFHLDHDREGNENEAHQTCSTSCALRMHPRMETTRPAAPACSSYTMLGREDSSLRIWRSSESYLSLPICHPSRLGEVSGTFSGSVVHVLSCSRSKPALACHAANQDIICIPPDRIALLLELWRR